MSTTRSNTRGLLLLAGVLTVVLWQLPWGRQALFPFTLLATYAHEMGHGLTALLLGGEFRSLEMYPDATGRALWGGSGQVMRALVAAGGLVGPSIAGAALLMISRRREHAPTILVTLGILMGLSALIWARSLFALVFIFAVAGFFVLLARYAAALAPFAVQLVGVQLCLAVFNDLDYMFSEGAVVDGVRQLSDSAAIADALLLPYWFWGGLVALISFGVLALGLWVALRAPPLRA